MKKLEMEHFDTITEYLLANKPKSVFDAGFGDLKWLEWCIKHRIKFEGVEIDPVLIKKGHESYPTFKDKLHEGDLTEGALDKFPDNYADVVLLIEVVEHIKTPEKCLALVKECARLAKKRVIITTPNCGDESFLKQHGLIYNHYTHVATDGMKFTKDRAHRHWIRFTKSNLASMLGKAFTHYVVLEKRPIQILKVACYDKLWAEVDVEREKANGSAKDD